MKKRLFLIVFSLLTLPLLAHAQGAFYQGIALYNSSGTAKILPSAVITVCPANSSGTPCTPASVLLFSDALLSTSLSNPFNADVNGNYSFFANSGNYTVTVTGVGFSGRSDQISISNNSSPINSGTTGNLIKYGTTSTGSDSGFPVSETPQLNIDNIWTGNNRFKGPVPWVDITADGARAINSTSGYNTVTATIGSTSKTVTLSGVGSYANGDYIDIIGAGSGNTAGSVAPSAPVITPSIASGPLNSNQVAPSSAGAVEYDYKFMWCDVATLSCTPVSVAGSTLNGLATLGRQTVAITSIARSGSTATVTSSAHLLKVAACSGATCPEVQVWKGTDPSFTGFARVLTVPGNTSFTYTTPGSTVYGATTSSTGGEFQYFVGNEIDCGAAPVATTSICVVYGRSSGSYAYIGSSRMGETKFDDWGATISGSLPRPWFVPATPPAAAQNNVLYTYVTAGGGTTTLTLNDVASTSVTSQASSLDQCKNFQNAATDAIAGGSGLYIPATNGSSHYGFVIASFCAMPAYLQVRQVGNVYATNMIELVGKNNLWVANRNGANNGGGAIYYTGLPAMYLASGYNLSTVDGVDFQSTDANGGLSILSDQSTYDTVIHNMFQEGSGGNVSYLGMAELIRGGSFENQFLYNYFFGDYTNGGSNLGDTTAPSVMFLANGGNLMSGYFVYNQGYTKGIAALGDPPQGDDLIVDHFHVQGPVNPIVTTDAHFDQNQMKLDHVMVDSTAAPVFTMLSSIYWTNTVQIDWSWPGGADTGGFAPLTSGNYIADLQVKGLSAGHPIGQNFDVNGGGSSGINLNAIKLTMPATTVGALPAAVTGNAGMIMVVSDSTAVAAEGQTCVGTNSHVALAFSDGTAWKCF